MIFVEKLVLAQKIDYFKNNSSRILHTSTAIALPSNPLLKSVPENYYLQNIGIFCKQEWKFEKATKIPLRIRVGSLQQCNWLEGKKYWAP
jgi:hypothetical protein